MNNIGSCMSPLNKTKRNWVLAAEVIATLIVLFYSIGELLNTQINITYEVLYVSDSYWLSTISNSIALAVYSVIVLMCCGFNFSRLPHRGESDDKHYLFTTPKSCSKTLLVLLFLFSIVIAIMDCVVMYNCIHFKMTEMKYVNIGWLKWFVTFKSLVLGYLCLCLFVLFYTAYH